MVDEDGFTYSQIVLGNEVKGEQVVVFASFFVINIHFFQIIVGKFEFLKSDLDDISLKKGKTVLRLKVAR